MKKKFKYYNELRHILIVLGIIFIWVGVVISFSKPEEEKTKETIPKIVVNTKIKKGDEIQNEQYKIHLITSKYEKYSFRNRNINSKNKYTIMYPNKLNQKTISDADLIIGNGNISIKGLCSASNSFEEYEEKLVKEYENKEDTKYNVSISNEINKIEDFDVKYLKIETLEKSITDDDKIVDFYSEKFIVLIKESNTSICEISYLIYEQKFTDEMLTNFINNIKINKNKANFLYTKVIDNKIEGTLSQKNIREASKKYNLSYQLESDKYKEIEHDQNDIYSHTFEKKNTNLKINLSLVSLLSTETFIEDYISFIKEEINLKEDLTIKNISYNLKTYNNREYYEIDLLYFDIEENLNINSKYLITKLDENIYYIIKLEDTKTIEIINDFFEFDFKEIK